MAPASEECWAYGLAIQLFGLQPGAVYRAISVHKNSGVYTEVGHHLEWIASVISKFSWYVDRAPALYTRWSRFLSFSITASFSNDSWHATLMRNKLSLMNTVYWNNMTELEKMAIAKHFNFEGHLTSRQSFWALIITRPVHQPINYLLSWSRTQPGRKCISGVFKAEETRLVAASVVLSKA